MFRVNDVIFINPGNSTAIYQDLATDFTAIEPPTWSLLLAQSVRAIGFSPEILDVNAECLSIGEAVGRVKEGRHRLICFVVYGQNPNSGTVNMGGAVLLAEAIKEAGVVAPICVVGSHVSALPRQTLETEHAFDFVFCNEGVYALRNILSLSQITPSTLSEINGIAYREADRIVLTKPEKIVPQERMDIDLPGYAWDLLPHKDEPLDLYRSHFWHAEYDHKKRTPFAAIYTSLGCTFQCSFCMINILNRNDQRDIGVASDYSKMRFWSPELIIKEFDTLVSLGVESIRISDEMFLLNKKYFIPLCEMLRDRGYGKRLRMWAYSRVDTASNPDHLKLVRAAGIKWLCLGIESADKNVRTEITKGRFEDIDIHEVVKRVHSADIEIIANYLFGLPADTLETMQKTLDLGLELNTTAWNGYAAMALPGSALYRDAVDKGYELPDTYTGYSFHAYDTLPLPTDSLSPAEILRFRDQAWHTYHSSKKFLSRVEEKLGEQAVQNISKMSKIHLKRRLLVD
jgi:anaerobic magnesium-protoporphyrin IX monomethyl ester cyclase